MYKKLTIFIITLLFGGFVLSSYEHGPAYEAGLNRTGSTGGAANCSGSGCHSPNDPSTIVAVQVKDASGTAVTHYAPGSTYTVTISGHNTTTEELKEFGFQVSAVKTTAATQAGTFTAIASTNIRVTAVAGIQIAEHKKPLDQTSTNTYAASFKWTAPAAGSGSVTFFGILNPIADDGDKPGHASENPVKKTTDDDNEDNDDDNDDNDDDELGASYPNVSPNLVLTEGQAAAGVATTGLANAVSCYPNPCTDVLNVKIAYGATGSYEVAIYDLSGKMVASATIDASLMSNTATISTASLPAGMYMLRTTNADGVITMPIVKQ